MTNNEDRTLIVYEKSHLLHEQYFKYRNISHSKNWNLIDIDYLNSIKDSKRILKVNAGDLVIWDSRTFHQNQYGKINNEESTIFMLSSKNVKENNKHKPRKD